MVFTRINEGESAADFCGDARGRRELLGDDYLTLHVDGMDVALVRERARLIEGELQRGRRSAGDEVRDGDVIISGIVVAVLAAEAHVMAGDPVIGQVHLYRLPDLDGECGVLLTAELEEVVAHLPRDLAPP